MSQEKIEIATRVGRCPTYVMTCDGDGPWPGVILYMDGVGIRPALLANARRLADMGYIVFVPDLFYRFGPYGPLDPKEVFAGDFRTVLGPMIRTTGNGQAVEDSEAILAHLLNRDDVVRGPVGTVGFCMGGGMALSVAGTFPDRIGAVASFHGGNLATDAPDSPHLLASSILAEVYVAGADADTSFPLEMAERLTDAFNQAGVRHRTEIYAGASHGWMSPDFPVFDAHAAERGWRELHGLFDHALK